MSQENNTNNQVPESSTQDQGKKKTAKNGFKKKDSPLRTKAKSMFDSSAPSLNADSFFSSYQDTSRNNVDVVFDPEFTNRVSVGYVDQAKTQALKDLAPEDDTQYQVLTKGLVQLTVIRKLMLGTSADETSGLSKFDSIVKSELFVPRNLAAVVANLGSFAVDDYIGRIKYGGLDVHRQLLELCKNMNRHPKVQAGEFFSPVPVYDDEGGIDHFLPWEEVDSTKVIVPNDASTRWIRDEAKDYLDQAFAHTWDVDDGHGGVMTVSYPRLDIVTNPDRQLEKVIAWIGTLSPHHPQVHQVIAAGLCTAWQTIWSKMADKAINRLVPTLPDWMNLTPRLLLAQFEVTIWDASRTLMLAGNDPISMIYYVTDLIKDSREFYQRFLDLVKMPDDKLGTEAQMFPLQADDYIERPVFGIPGDVYYALRKESESRVISKFKNKGLATIGIAAGFVKDVQFKTNYKASVVGNPFSILAQVLRPDYKSGHF